MGKTSLPVGESLLLVLVALALAAVSYSLFENPIRHLHLTSRNSVISGVALALATVLILSAFIFGESAPSSRHVVPAANEQVVLREVAAASRITHVPRSIQPALVKASSDWGGNYESPACVAGESQSSEHICKLGDTTSNRLLVVYGDSRAQMWLPAFEFIAESAHWKLVLLAKDYCPAEPVTIANGNYSTSGADTKCDQWHTWALRWINEHHPSLLVVSQLSAYDRPASGGHPAEPFTPAQWGKGLATLFTSIKVPNLRMIYLGGTAGFPRVVPPPRCLAEHLADVQACTIPARSAVPLMNPVEESTTRAAGVEYVDPNPWFCSDVCSPVIGHYEVYLDGIHITASWAQYLEIVLANALDISIPQQKHRPS